MQPELSEDEELVLKVKNGDREAEEYLLQKYSYIVKREARYLFLVGAEPEDLIQEGMIGLVKAIRTFETGHDAQFSTFATLCIRSQISTAITKASRKKHSPLNSYISLDSKEKEDTSVLESFSEETNLGPEVIVERQEHDREMRESLETLLSSFEKKVVELYLQGITYAEIGRRLGKEEKSIQNAISRIRIKVKKNETKK